METFIEFFSGIGGLSACLPDSSESVSIDINQNALTVFGMNFRHPSICKTIESLDASELVRFPADLWWMSPPCQPFTRRGRQRDLDDPRSAGFKNLLTLIDSLKPPRIGLENVPEFMTSRSRQILMATLRRNDYQVAEITLCPTQLGSVNRRERYYLIASKNRIDAWRPIQSRDRPVRLECGIKLDDIALPGEWLEKYEEAIHVVDESAFVDGTATTNCFTSAYGRSPVRSGSYLRTANEVRLFTPMEILWQLGFPEGFQLPNWPAQKLWPLAGNTLALPAVKYVLDHLT